MAWRYGRFGRDQTGDGRRRDRWRFSGRPVRRAWALAQRATPGAGPGPQNKVPRPADENGASPLRQVIGPPGAETLIVGFGGGALRQWEVVEPLTSAARLIPLQGIDPHRRSG